MMTESLLLVLSGDYFLFNVSTVVSLGMIIGYKLNEGLDGFKKSITILLPYSALLILTIYSRLLGVEVTAANAYNGIITIIITSVAYITGLFLGHVVFNKAKKDAVNESEKAREQIRGIIKVGQ